MEAVVQGVGVTSFITLSNASKEAFKTATLLKTLNVNALITGEDGVGKKSLASYILPNATVVDASDHEVSLTTLSNASEVVLTNLHLSPNINILVDTINSNDIRVIATSKGYASNEKIDEIFSVKFGIPPLAQREEDIQPLVQRFVADAVKLFDGHAEFDTEHFIPDVSMNSHSLRRQVMINYLLQDIHDLELMKIIENYLFDKLGSNSDYRKFLYLYEVPLIQAGLNRFKSQLQLADKLGLNRNTLRKKIADNKEYL